MSEPALARGTRRRKMAVIERPPEGVATRKVRMEPRLDLWAERGCYSASVVRAAMVILDGKSPADYCISGTADRNDGIDVWEDRLRDRKLVDWIDHHNRTLCRRLLACVEVIHELYLDRRAMLSARIMDDSFFPLEVVGRPWAREDAWGVQVRWENNLYTFCGVVEADVCQAVLARAAAEERMIGDRVMEDRDYFPCFLQAAHTVRGPSGCVHEYGMATEDVRRAMIDRYERAKMAIVEAAANDGSYQLRFIESPPPVGDRMVLRGPGGAEICFRKEEICFMPIEEKMRSVHHSFYESLASRRGLDRLDVGTRGELCVVWDESGYSVLLGGGVGSNSIVVEDEWYTRTHTRICQEAYSAVKEELRMREEALTMRISVDPTFLPAVADIGDTLRVCTPSSVCGHSGKDTHYDEARFSRGSFMALVVEARYQSAFERVGALVGK